MNHKAEKWLDKERRNIISLLWLRSVSLPPRCWWCRIFVRQERRMKTKLVQLWTFVTVNQLMRYSATWPGTDAQSALVSLAFLLCVQKQDNRKKSSLNALWVWNESLKKRKKENQLGCATQWHKCHDQDYGFYFSSHTNRLLCKHTAQESSLISLIANTRKGDCDNKARCFSHRVIHGYYSGKIIFTELQCEHSHRDLKWIQMVQHEGDECGAVLFVAHQSGSPASGDNI